ncbi:unnamed protein product [Mytilus coruscus]|uniref:Uncharacterized protein n=1 Tax=Mytilus coruscus TaxID=42192 RepID=A0A6J8AEU9_MYTCO|nr:unnamed protein product [Mytilus coruscus]
MTVRLTTKKVANIVNLCVEMLNKEFITVREFAKLIGKLIASEHGVLYAPLFYKTLEIQKDFGLKINKGNFDRKMKLSKESIDCVNWWILNLPYSFKPIVFKSPDRKIESDSSMIGYGAHDVTNNSDISVDVNFSFLTFPLKSDLCHVINCSLMLFWEIEPYQINIKLQLSDTSEEVIHSNDAFAPVSYLNLQSVHVEDKHLVTNI